MRDNGGQVGEFSEKIAEDFGSVGGIQDGADDAVGGFAYGERVAHVREDGGDLGRESMNTKSKTGRFGELRLACEPGTEATGLGGGLGDRVDVLGGGEGTEGFDLSATAFGAVEEADHEDDAALGRWELEGVGGEGVGGGVAGGAGGVGDDEAVGFEEAVAKGGFADVGAADEAEG